MSTQWQDCQCECDAGKIGNRSPQQVLSESGVLEAVSFYDSTGELINSFTDEQASMLYPVLFCAAASCSVLSGSGII